MYILISEKILKVLVGVCKTGLYTGIYRYLQIDIFHIYTHLYLYMYNLFELSARYQTGLLYSDQCYARNLFTFSTFYTYIWSVFECSHS